ARETFLNVVMPVLKAAVSRFQSNKQIEGYAIEVSHHIVGKVMGVSLEHPENLMVYMPQASAIRLVGAKAEPVQQAALLKGPVYRNSRPLTSGISGEGPQLTPEQGDAPGKGQENRVGAEIVPDEDPSAVASTTALPLTSKTAAPPPPRDTSPAALSTLQQANQ